jgi:integrase
MTPRKLPPLEIRDKRLRGGRLVISPRTDSLPVWRRRDAALRQLLEAGEFAVIERLRSRCDSLQIGDVQRAVEAKRVAELRPTVEPDGSPALTLGAEVDRIMTRLAGDGSAASTIKEYRTITGQFVARFGRDTLLRDISSDLIQTWLHEPKPGRWPKKYAPRPWSRARQQVAMAFIGRLFNLAIRREAETADRLGIAPRIALNPRANVELAKERTRRVEFLQPREWATLSEATRGRAVRAVVALGTLAGLRIAEIAYLRTGIDVEGLDTDSPVIHVQPRGGQHPWRPKSNRSVRDIPVCEELRAILRLHVEAGFAGERYFTRTPSTDRPMSTQGLRQWTRLAFHEAGIRYGRRKDALTPHSLRHTFISWLVQADVSLLKIERLAGTSVAMIIEVYGHLLDTDLRKAVGEIDRRLGEVRPAAATEAVSSEKSSESPARHREAVGALT